MDMLYLLALLACPLGMGLMMWFMMRGQHSGNSTPSTGNEQQQELARLRTEVEDLRKQQDPNSTRSN